MISLILFFFGTFWESSMDILGMKHNYELSIWKHIANWFDKRGIHSFGNQFWDNTIAWKNKWKNKDPKQGEAFLGSSTIFVIIKDGWHVVKAFWHLHIFFSIVLYKPVTNSIIADAVIFYMAYGIGHELFFNGLQFKKK